MKKTNSLLIIVIIIFVLIITLLIINKPTNKEGELKKITYNEIKEKIKNKDDFILIISRSNCSHCQTYKPKIAEITKDYNIIAYYIDYDKEKEPEKFLEEFNLEAVTPTTIFIKNGKETSILNRMEGDLEKNKVIEKFKKMGFIKQ